VAGRHRKQHAVRPHAQHGRHRKPPSRPRAVLPTVAIVAVLAVGGLVFGREIGRAIAQGQPPREAVVTPRQPLVVPSVAASPDPPAPPVATKARHRHHHHRVPPPALRLRDVHGSCYVEVSRHGHVLTRRILHRGQRVVVRRGGLDVVLGNAGAVRISTHGHASRRPGPTGQVRTLHVR